jgi:hypothetical protein
MSFPFEEAGEGGMKGQWLPNDRGSFPGDKAAGACEADHSSPSSTEVKKMSYTATPQYEFMVCLFKYRDIYVVWYLVKHRDNFTFTFLFFSGLVTISEDRSDWNQLTIQERIFC